jgi:hypothetical protein
MMYVRAKDTKKKDHTLPMPTITIGFNSKCRLSQSIDLIFPY